MIICDKCVHKMYCIDYGRKTDKCEYFDQMTNEEWFCGLSTEEKAKVLETIIRRVLVQRPPMCHDVCNSEFWETWLKQPHTTRS